MNPIIDTRDRLDGISPLHKFTYLRAEVLREWIAEREPVILAGLVEETGDLYFPNNNLSGVITAVRSPLTAELIAAKFSLELLEASAVYRDAAKLMGPALDLIAKDNAEIAERERIESEARSAIVAAEEAAKAKAAAAVEKDPAVIAARQKLAALA